MNNFDKNLSIFYKKGVNILEIFVIGIVGGIGFYALEKSVIFGFIILITLALIFLIIECYLNKKYKKRCPYCEKEWKIS